MIKKNLLAQSLILFSIFSINQCYAVTVGDSYGGGTVFCVSKTPDTTQCVTEGSGDYGLIMANEDQANFDSNPQRGVTWSSAYKIISGAQSLDNGATNTAAIIAAFPQDNPSNNAAWLCHNYKDPIEGHTDWYLPSKNELNKMYVYAKAHNLIGRGCSGSKAGGAQCLVGGYNETYKYYWSSSESSDYYDGYAWGQAFSNGSQGRSSKVSGYVGVRTIRAFNNSPIYQFNNLLLKGYSRAAALVFMIKNQNSDIECLRFAFSHPDLDAAGLTAISQHHNVDVNLLRGIASHPRVNAALLAIIAIRPNADSATLLVVARNSITNIDGLQAVVAHPNINGAVLEVVAQRPESSVLRQAIEQKQQRDALLKIHNSANMDSGIRTDVAKLSKTLDFTNMDLSTGAIDVARLLDTRPDFTSLDLTNTNLTDNGWQIILGALRKNRVITEIKYNKDKTSLEVQGQIAVLLALNGGERNLALESLGLKSRTSFSYALGSLADHASTTLNLSSFTLDLDRVQILSEFITKNKRLRAINLHGVKCIGEEGGIILDAMKQNTPLNIDFTEAELDEDAVFVLCEFVKDKPIARINFTNCKIPSSELSSLQAALKQNSSIREVVGL